MQKRRVVTFLLIILAIAGIARSGFADLLINGAGATFPYPIYSKWFDVYAKENPGVKFNYQSIGSGGGIRMLSNRTVDVGASDAPLTDAQLADAPGKILHFPSVMGAVVIAYNIPGFTGTMRLTGAVIADIFAEGSSLTPSPNYAKSNFSWCICGSLFTSSVRLRICSNSCK